MNMCAAPISADDTGRWIAVCSLQQLQAKQIVCADVNGLSLLVISDGDAVHAVERACPHEQADLALGHVANGRLHCPRHLASFDLNSGDISAGWSCRALRRYPVRIKHSTVFIDPGRGHQAPQP